MLGLKAQSGLGKSRLVSLGALREIVGAPDHRATAASIAQRAITLIRDDSGLVPLRTDGRVLIVQYAPETELRAGRIFGTALRTGRAAARQISNGGLGTPSTSGSGPPVTTIARLTPGATGDLLDSIGLVADSSDVVVIAAFVRRVEGVGRVAVPQQVAAWIDSVAMRRPVIVVSFGNPYLIQQFPGADGYIATYGVSDDLERAAVRALLGQEAITGKTPVSLPGFFGLGAGLTRARADSTR